MYHRDIVIEDLHEEGIMGMFYEKEFQKTNQTEFRVENLIRKKVINYMVSGKCMRIREMVGLIKRYHYIK